VGSGMSGGWVAKEMCEKGFKVAVLERGRDIVPVEDYTDMVDPWDMEHLNQKSPADEADYPIQSEVYAFHSYTKQFWVKDTEHPYIVPEGQDYKWRRGYHTGGRSIMWGRQSYRLSEIDFEANKKDGHGVDWPVRTSLNPLLSKRHWGAGAVLREITVSAVVHLVRILAPIPLHFRRRATQAI